MVMAAIDGRFYALSSVIMGEPSVSGRNSIESAAISNSSSLSESPDIFRQVKMTDGSKLAVIAKLAQIEVLPFGNPGTLSHRIALTANGREQVISPWADVQLLWQGGLLSCICKSPVGTWLRYEVAMDEPHHPLRPARIQSAFKDYVERKIEMGSTMPERGSRGWVSLRTHMQGSFRPAHFVDNSPWNIGMLPQTQENSEGSRGKVPTVDKMLEIIDVGHAKTRKTGEVYPIKPLGAFSVKHPSGDVSWKIFGIDLEDSMADLLNSMDDVQLLLPGILELLRDWLRTCLQTKPGMSNGCRVNGPFKMETAVNKIRECHKEFKRSKNKQGNHSSCSSPMISPRSLESTWSRRTTKRDKGLYLPVPVSNPNSLLLYDRSWFGGESVLDDLVVDIVDAASTAEMADEGPAHIDLSLVSFKKLDATRTHLVTNLVNPIRADSFMDANTHKMTLEARRMAAEVILSTVRVSKNLLDSKIRLSPKQPSLPQNPKGRTFLGALFKKKRPAKFGTL